MMRYFKILMTDGATKIIRRERKSEITDIELCDVVRMAQECMSGEDTVKEVYVCTEADYLGRNLNN